MSRQDAVVMANSVDPDGSVSLIWVNTFAEVCLSKNLGSLRYNSFFNMLCMQASVRLQTNFDKLYIKFCSIALTKSTALCIVLQQSHEKISTAILPLPLIQEEQLSVTGERMCTKYW